MRALFATPPFTMPSAMKATKSSSSEAPTPKAMKAMKSMASAAPGPKDMKAMKEAKKEAAPAPKDMKAMKRDQSKVTMHEISSSETFGNF